MKRKSRTPRKRDPEGHKAITQEDIQRALQEFYRKGGIIKKLPPEVAPPGSMVGDRHGAYENLHSLAHNA